MSGGQYTQARSSNRIWCLPLGRRRVPATWCATVVPIPLMRRTLALAVLITLAACGGEDSSEPPVERPPSGVSEEAVTRIQQLDDCEALQREFDIGERNGGERGLFFMNLADARMEEIGCYG